MCRISLKGGGVCDWCSFDVLCIVAGRSVMSAIR